MTFTARFTRLPTVPYYSDHLPVCNSETSKSAAFPVSRSRGLLRSPTTYGVEVGFPRQCLGWVCSVSYLRSAAQDAQKRTRRQRRTGQQARHCKTERLRDCGPAQPNPLCRRGLSGAREAQRVDRRSHDDGGCVGHPPPQCSWLSRFTGCVALPPQRNGTWEDPCNRGPISENPYKRFAQENA